MAETLLLEGAASGTPLSSPSSSGPREDALLRLTNELSSVCGVVNATQARRVRLLSEVLATEAWTGPGIRSAAHWVGWQCGTTPGHAQDLVQMARRLPTMPVTSGLFETGQLSEDHVKVICRRVPDAFEADVAELALALTSTQLSQVVNEYPFHEDPDEAEDDDDPDRPEKRRVSFGGAGDELWRLHAQLPADEGATMERAITAARDDLFHEGDEEATWADALIRLGNSYLGGRVDAQASRDRYRVLVHLNAQRPLDTEPQPEPHAHFHLGSALPDSIRRLITCDADLTPVFAYRGVIHRTGVAQRTVGARTRIAIEQRDKGCRVPGCGHTRWLQIHHVVHWEDGGPTRSENLCALCATHHRQHHNGDLGIGGDADRPDGLTFTDRRGRRIMPPRPPPPVTGHPYDAARAREIPVAPYECARGERADWRWLKLYPRGPSAPSAN